MTRLYAGAVVDDEKPTWEDDIDIGDIDVVQDSKRDKKKKKKKKKKKDEDDVDEGGIYVDDMDADIIRDDDEEWDGTEEMRKRKLKEHMDELDALDFNDVVRICAYILLCLSCCKRPFRSAVCPRGSDTPQSSRRHSR